MLAQLKKHLTPRELWSDVKFFFLLNLGLVATAVGIAVFKTPNHFAFGGTSGLSIVLATLFPRWNVGAFMWFINAALVALGFVFLGVRSMGWTIYSSFALSFYVSLCERVYPLSRRPMMSFWSFALRSFCRLWVRPSSLTSVRPPEAPTLWR